jgi:hypothetical protein
MYDPKTTRELVVVDVDEIDPQRARETNGGKKRNGGIKVVWREDPPLPYYLSQVIHHLPPPTPTLPSSSSSDLRPPSR